MYCAGRGLCNGPIPRPKEANRVGEGVERNQTKENVRDVGEGALY